jgi:hypothetical protein
MNLANPEDNVHIEPHGLTRSNCEGLWPSANTSAHTILDIENTDWSSAKTASWM